MLKLLKKSLVICSILSSIPVVYAQYDDFGSAFGEIGRLFVSILIGIVEFLKPLIDFISNNENGTYVGRVLLGIILSLIFYRGMKDVEAIKGGTARLISIFLAIIAAIGIPENIIKALFGAEWQLWLYILCIAIFYLTKGEWRLGLALRGGAFIVLSVMTLRIYKLVPYPGNLLVAIVTVAFAVQAVYYLFYKLWTGLSAEGKGTEIGTGIKAPFKEAKNLVDAIRGSGDKENKLIKELELIEARDVGTIDDIIHTLNDLKDFISRKGISKDTQNKIMDLSRSLIDKVKLSEALLNRSTNNINRIDEMIRNELTPASITNIIKQQTGLTKKQLNTKQMKIREISSRYTGSAFNIKSILRTDINTLLGLERKNRNSLNDLIGKIRLSDRGAATTVIDDIIKGYNAEKSVIGNIINVEEQLTDINDDFMGELTTIAAAP